MHMLFLCLLLTSFRDVVFCETYTLIHCHSFLYNSEIKTKVTLNKTYAEKRGKNEILPLPPKKRKKNKQTKTQVTPLPHTPQSQTSKVPYQNVWKE